MRCMIAGVDTCQSQGGPLNAFPFHAPACTAFALSVLLSGASTSVAADAPFTPDPEIARLVRGVSQERLEAHVRTLAGFGTRHSLSSADDPARGIGAARRWIKDTLDRCAADPGARLKVEFDEFVQEATPRIPKATTLVNVVATLEGADPQARARTHRRVRPL